MAEPPGPDDRLNVLFICVDDLRPELGCYGEDIISPNLDRLAREGRMFTRHFVQFPTCGASRFSMLTGRGPTAAAHYTNSAFEWHARQESRVVSMPEAFRRAGYTTVSIGKVSHAPDGVNPDGSAELPGAWDRASGPTGQWQDSWRAFFGYAGGRTREIGVTPAIEQADVDDEGYPDGLIATMAEDELAALADADEPFFLAVGFFKPHLPLNAPRKYWDLYDHNAIEISPNPQRPRGVEDNAVNTLYHRGELYPRYTGVGTDEGWSLDDHRLLRHGYFACVSYVDAQIGRVLDRLDALGLADNTIVVVWGDHGWHLGDHAIFGKHTTFERSLRSVLMVRTPGTKRPGARADALVASVDLYPTLAELCDVPAPAGLDGVSLATMISDDPDVQVRDEVVSYWRKGKYLATSMRTDRYRLVRWYEKATGETVAVELYDHEEDPNETVNIANRFPRIVERLTERSAAVPVDTTTNGK
jgi:iduronate 2-sulfatase